MTRERNARAKLQLAQSAIEEGLIVLAKKFLTDITNEYTDTSAAKEGRELLRTLSPEWIPPTRLKVAKASSSLGAICLNYQNVNGKFFNAELSPAILQQTCLRSDVGPVLPDATQRIVDRWNRSCLTDAP